MKTFKRFILLSVVLLLFATPSATKAAQVNAFIYGALEYDSTLSGQVFAGWLTGDDFVAYCVDRKNPLPQNVVWADVKGLGSTGSIYQQAAYIMDKHDPFITGHNETTFSYEETSYMTQLAIWKLTGQLGYAPAIIDPVSYMIYFNHINTYWIPAALSSTENFNGRYALLDLYNDSDKTIQYQKLIAPVPIPAAIWLLGCGLVGLFGLKRRKNI